MPIQSKNRGSVETSLSRFAPLALVAAFALGFVGSLLLFFTIRAWDQTRFQSAFHQECQQTVSVLQQGVNSHLYLLESLRGLYEASDHLSRNEFTHFVKDFQDRCPGLQAIEWIPRVPHGERKQYEEMARREGFPDFRITEMGDKGEYIPAAKRQEYYPVYYLEPYVGNEAALGFDIASERVRRQTLTLSRDTGRLAATPPLVLVQEKGLQQGFLVFLPVYKRGSGPDSVVSRTEYIAGFFLAVYRVEDFLNSILRNHSISGVELYVLDQSSDGRDNLMFFRSFPKEGASITEPRKKADFVAGPHYSGTLNVGGRQWSLLLTPTPAWLKTSHTWLPWGALGAGVLCTLLMTAYLAQVQRRGAQARRHAMEQAVARESLDQEWAKRESIERELKESERRYRTLFESATDGILIMEAEEPNPGRIVAANSAAAAMHGYTREEILSLYLGDLATPESARHIPHRMELLRKGEHLREEFTHRKKDGTVFPLEINARLIQLEGRSYLLAIDRDITERKAQEVALRQRDYQKRAILDNIPDIAWLKDQESRFIAVNEPFARACGVKAKDLPGKTDLDLWPSELAEMYRADDREVMRSGKRKRVEEPLADQEGQIKWIETIKTPILDESGKVIGTTGIARDITERKMMDEALRESEERYRLLVEMSPDGIAVHQEGKLVFVNPAGVMMLGAQNRDELIEKRIQDIIHPDHWEDAINRIKRMMKGETGLYPVEDCYVKTDGTAFPVEVTALSLTYDGKPAVQVVVRDITDRKQAEESLAEASRRLQMAVEAANVGLWDWNLETDEVHYSREWKRQIGYGDHEISNAFSEWESRVHPDDLGNAVRRVRDYLENPWPGFANEFRFRHKDGSYRWIRAQGSLLHDDQGKPVRMTGCHLDITERVRAEESLRERDNLMREMSRIAKIGAWEFDPVTLKGTWTDEVTRILEGAPDLSFNLESGVNLFQGESHRIIASAVREAMEQGKPYDLELEVITPKGNRKWVRTIGQPLEHGNRVVQVKGILQDITERVQAEEILRERDNLLREMSRIAKIGAWEFDPVTLKGTWTDEVMRIHEVDPKLEPDVELGLSLYQGESRRKIEKAVEEAIEHGTPYELELEMTTPRGNHKWVRAIGQAVKHGERVVQVKGTLQDITDRVQMEESLRESEQKYRTLFEQSAEAIIIVLHGGVIVDANPACSTLFGVSRNEIVGKNVLDFYADSTDHVAFRRAVNGDGFVRDFEMMVRRQDGTVRYCLFNSSIWQDEFGESMGYLSIIRDMTEQKKFQEVQARLATAISQSAESVIITDAQGHIQYSNPAFERITGYSLDEVVGKHPRFLRSEDQDEIVYAGLEKTMRKGDTWSGRLVGRTKDGKPYYEDTTVSPVRDSSGAITNFVQLGHDVAERLELEKQLLQSQKMEAIGTLAGGVAHDFNNILQVALGYSELILGDEDLPPHFREDMQKIYESAQLGADLVQRLLTFSRKTEIKPKPLNLNRRIAEMRKMLERTIPKMIDIQLILGEKLATIDADPTQIDQILMNLALNARDAMPEGGKLIVETENIVLDEEYAKSHLGANTGRHVLLMVTDTGSGMDEETLDHIFEPFYTTKRVGEGTGLGLAMVHGIVVHHGGHIRCYSEPGVGTTFKIYFPAPISEKEKEEATVRKMPRGGTETILLVDDEASIRDLGSRILTRSGYSVIAVSNGKEALQVFQERRHEIDLVMLDLIMPEMGGKQCLEGLLELDPRVNVVIASGYSVNGPAKEALAAGAKGFVSKPYNLRQILEVVREVLDDG